MEILLSIFYAIIFILLIRKLKFFETDLSKNSLSIFFSIKVLFGVMLWWIYTYYYTDHATADIYKYFDDSKVMYDALWVHPSDYVKMLLGIQNDNPYFDRIYYTHMNHWYHEFGNNIYNDNHTIIRFNAFVRLFSFGYYNVHSVFICFISFIGLTAIYKTFINYLSDKKKELALAVFLIPSVLLWSSGVLKEGFLFFGLGMLVYYFHKIVFEKFSLLNLFWIVVSVIALMLAKFYVLACLAPGMIAWVWLSRSNKRITLKFLVTTILLFVLALNIQYVFPKYNLLKQLVWKQGDFVNAAKGGTYLTADALPIHPGIVKRDTIYIPPKETDSLVWIKKDSFCTIAAGTKIYHWSKGTLVDSGTAGISSKDIILRSIKYYEPANSRIAITPLEPTLSSLFKNTPEAFLNSLLRPYPMESRSPMILFPAIENILLLLFCLLCLVLSNFKKADLRIFYFCLIFVFLLYTLTGLTTPVTGAIVRYRIPAMPFLLIGFLSILEKEKLLKKIPFLKFLK